jgi:predicted amidohydrolase YtcJ
MMILSCTTTPKEEADLLISRARIYTVDSAFHVYEAMAVRAGKILELGSDVDLKKKYKAKVYQEFNGSPIYPGFIDAHCHFYGYGLARERYADLVGTKSFEEVLQRVREYAETHPEQSWILGRGWDQNDWEKEEFPDNTRLNELFPAIPVLLIRIDGHAVLVNDKALELAGFSTETKISGGDLLQKDGKLTGVVLDNAADSLKALVPEADEALIRKALLRAQDDCFAVGLTAVVDAGLSNRLVHQIDEMQQEGSLKMRMDVMLNPSQKNFDEFVQKDIYKTDRLIVKSVKLYADGALGSRGACLLEPYSDDIHNHGFLIHNPQYYDSVCHLIYDAGYQANTHAIGDSAVRTVLKTYAKYLGGKNDRRWRIEHAQVVNPADFHYFGDYSIIPAVNTTHATSDMYWAGERLGPERIKTAYAYHQLLEENGWLTNGSDFPVESINPLFGFYAAVARKDQKGWPEQGFQAENRLSREEALKAMTIWAAKGSFVERERGSLEPGKFADFVVLQRDIMKIPEEELFKTTVLMTFINGELVYRQKK